MNFQFLLETLRQYVESYFEQQNTADLFYHDLLHTKEVVKVAAQIANHYQLSDEDFFITCASAWFHDIGYFEDAGNHEEKSVAIATTFLQHHELAPTIIQNVKDCILATRIPQHPVGLLQQIVCDADLFHLGTRNFAEHNKMLYKEYKANKDATLSKHEWRQRSILFLEAHHYCTDYCRLLLNGAKKKHLNDLKKKAEEWEEKTSSIVSNSVAIEEDSSEALYGYKKPGSMNLDSTVSPVESSTSQAKLVEGVGKRKKVDHPEKGVETMFRVTSGNHQRLSDMADNKAHIMITVNSIILSAIISLLLRRLEDKPYLTIPTFITLGVSLTAIIFAILSTRPHIPQGTFSNKEVEDKTVNLLFFGNFYRMNLSAYKAGMEQMMVDRSFLYGSLIKDVYSQGVVLGRKYRLLRMSYNIFMFGLIVSVLAFILVYALSTKN